jgi:DNA polymerase III alpha subunit
MALRGSAGNSLVCYLLGITDVDPLRFRLELERFLHPGRPDLPDIDLDFDWKERDSVIEEVTRRYGFDHVARVCMHLMFQPRSAFREAGKVHGLSTEQVSEMLLSLDERVDAIVIPEPGSPMPPCPRLFPLEPERWPRMVADARLLLGRPMLTALHPGGIVITPRPVADYAPLQWAAKGVVMMQYDKDAAEALGLVKIDLLGNRALSTVDEAKKHVASPVPPAVECHNDPATVALLRRGDTVGITQLESPAMRHLLVPMRVRGLDDVIQALALLRPGAASIGMKDLFIRRRNGKETPPPPHPLMELLLGETHGLMVYEDDAMRVLQALTCMDAARADLFRKRIAKHQTPEEGEALWREFVAMCRVPEGEVAELWAQMAKFNRYSFCKSHAVSYGLIAWQAAWLKAHHPAQFWSAALNNNQGAYPPRVYIEEVKRSGLRLLPPCVNASGLGFSVDGGAIRVGLDAVSGVPEAVRQAIVENRPYAGLSDLRRRVSIGPEALSALVRVGAFDFTGKSRPALFLEAEIGTPHEGELFSLDPAEGWSPPDDPPDRRWRDEWRILGFVLGPPLYSLFRPRLPVSGPPLVDSVDLHRHAGRTVRVQGLVATARLTHTEAGKPLQFITLEDERGLSEVTIFAGTCRPLPYLTIGPYVATGAVEDRHGAVTLTARSVTRHAS